MRRPPPPELRRVPKSARRDEAFRKTIRQIPKGKVATYAQVAAAAGYPLHHRQVAQLLRTAPTGSLPWQRVVGAGGESDGTRTIAELGHADCIRECLAAGLLETA